MCIHPLTLHAAQIYKEIKKMEIMSITTFIYFPYTGFFPIFREQLAHTHEIGIFTGVFSMQEIVSAGFNVLKNHLTATYLYTSALKIVPLVVRIFSMGFVKCLILRYFVHFESVRSIVNKNKYIFLLLLIYCSKL